MNYMARLRRVSALLDGAELKAYPAIWRVLEAWKGKYRTRLLALLDWAINTPNQERGAYGNLFFVSEGRLARMCAGGCKNQPAWHHTIILFACLGLIDRVQPTEQTARSQYQRSAVQIAQSRGEDFYATSFFSFPSYTKKQLNRVNKRAQKWMDVGKPTRLTQSAVDSIFGSEIKKRVFQAHGTQTNDRVQSAGERMRIDYIGKIATGEVEKHGFTTKTRVLEELRGFIFDHEKQKPENETIISTDAGRSYLLKKAELKAEKTWNTHGTRVLYRLGLVYCQQRKADKEKFSIPEYMTCWIIRKK